MAFRVVKAEMLRLSEELLHNIANIEGTDIERDLETKRLNGLREVAEKNLLIPFVWTVAKVKGKEDYMRCNGQHSSKMLSQLEKESFPEGFPVFWTEFECDTVEDLILLFRQYDSRTSSRKAIEISAIYQRQYEDLRLIDVRVAQMALQGAMWYRGKVEGFNVKNGDDIYSSFGDRHLHPFIVWFSTLIPKSTKGRQGTSFLAKQAILGAIYGTYEKSKSKAEIFWREVLKAPNKDEDGGGSASAFLAHWIRDEENKRSLAKEKDLYTVCISCWNDYIEGKSRYKVRSVRKKGQPLPEIKTP